MKINKKYLFLFLSILWMSIIFYFSSCSGETSSNQSNIILKIICNLFNINDTKMLSLIIRKIAHITEYFILTLLVSMYLKCYNIKTNKVIIYSFIICYLYACSDEIHQVFISNRGPSFKDTLIDSIGIIIWLIVYKLKGSKDDKRCII